MRCKSSLPKTKKANSHILFLCSFLKNPTSSITANNATIFTNTIREPEIGGMGGVGVSLSENYAIVFSDKSRRYDRGCGGSLVLSDALIPRT